MIICVRWLNGQLKSATVQPSSLMRTTEMVLETLVQSPFNHLTRLAAGESFTDWERILRLCHGQDELRVGFVKSARSSCVELVAGF